MGLRSDHSGRSAYRTCSVVLSTVDADMTMTVGCKAIVRGTWNLGTDVVKTIGSFKRAMYNGEASLGKILDRQ